MNLPFEIIEMILDNIKTIHHICNMRLVCKEWYNYLKNVKVYNNDNYLISQHFFDKNRFYTLDNNKNLIKEIIFLNYGKYEFKKYYQNKLIKKIVNKPPFFITSYDYYNNNIIIKELNIENSSVSTEIDYDKTIDQYNQCSIN